MLSDAMPEAWHGLLHQSCSHRQNEFVKTIRRHHGYLQVHTGTIDGVWRLLKQAIPDQLVTKRNNKKAEINSSLWTYISERGNGDGNLVKQAMPV